MNGSMKRFIIAVLIVALLGTVALTLGRLNRPLRWQKGMNYVTWSSDRYLSPDSDESLKALAKTGNEWVALVITWYQVDCASTDLSPTERTPSDASLIHAIKTIHSLGMKVMLKPQIDILDKSVGTWRGEIYCPTEQHWDRWFDSYADCILYYAELSQKQGVDMYCIGVELSSVATTRRQMWKDKVIVPVRKAYKGPITYAANWDGEYKNVTFWDLVDYVGIDAYFPLTDAESPTFEEIKRGWEGWVKDLEEFQATVSKPIIFPEVGYCSAAGAAKEPWIEIVSGKADMQLQADCYRALLETIWDKQWFYGLYWWKWGTDVRFGGPSNKGYSPQNKSAEQVLKTWYGKPFPARDPSKLKKAKK